MAFFDDEDELVEIDLDMDSRSIKYKLGYLRDFLLYYNTREYIAKVDSYKNTLIGYDGRRHNFNTDQQFLHYAISKDYDIFLMEDVYILDQEAFKKFIPCYIKHIFGDIIFANFKMFYDENVSPWSPEKFTCNEVKIDNALDEKFMYNLIQAKCLRLQIQGGTIDYIPKNIIFDSIQVTFNSNIKEIVIDQKCPISKININNCYNLLKLDVKCDKILDLNLHSIGQFVNIFLNVEHIWDISFSNSCLGEIKYPKNVYGKLDMTGCTMRDRYSLSNMSYIEYCCKLLFSNCQFASYIVSEQLLKDFDSHNCFPKVMNKMDVYYPAKAATEGFSVYRFGLKHSTLKEGFNSITFIEEERTYEKDGFMTTEKLSYDNLNNIYKFMHSPYEDNEKKHNYLGVSIIYRQRLDYVLIK